MDDKEFLKRLGLKIKIYRNLKGVSQDYMATSLCIDKSYYSKIERGQANATIIYLKHLAELLDTSLNILLSEEITLK